MKRQSYLARIAKALERIAEIQTARNQCDQDKGSLDNNTLHFCSLHLGHKGKHKWYKYEAVSK